MQAKDILGILEEEGDEKLLMRSLYNMKVHEMGRFDKMRKAYKERK